MKTFRILSLIIATLFISINSQAQVINLGACRSDSLVETGFDRLKEIVGDARIVVIGEQAHGVGTDYENFAFMVKFLHEELGFNVIAQEYCFYTIHDINSKGLSAQAYRNAMYWPQGKAKENDLLFDYLDAQKKAGTPLFMEGFDSRIFQRKSFYTFLDTLLTNLETDVTQSHQTERYLSILNNLLTYEYRDSISSSEDQQFFLENTDSIIYTMIPLPYSPRSIQLMKSLKNFAKNAWHAQLYPATNLDRFCYRERQMAENIFWLVEDMYPEEKIIIRMHNGHAAKNVRQLRGAIPDSLVKDSLNVGSRLHERYNDQCIHIATTYYSGTYCDWDYKLKKIPSPHLNSLETMLHNKGYQYAYANLKGLEETHMFYCDFNTWVGSGKIKASFEQFFDGVIFIDQVALPTEKIQPKNKDH